MGLNNDRGIGLGPGDYIAESSRQSVGAMNPTAATCQSAGLTVPAVIGAGRVVFADWANVAARANNNVVPGQDGNIFGSFLLAATAAERKRHGFVLQSNAAPGGQVFGVLDGLTQALTSDTIANMGVGVEFTISIANDNSRGCIVPATSGTPIFGQVVKPPAVNGSVAAPQFCTVVFNGEGPVNRLLP